MVNDSCNHVFIMFSLLYLFKETCSPDFPRKHNKNRVYVYIHGHVEKSADAKIGFGEIVKAADLSKLRKLASVIVTLNHKK